MAERVIVFIDGSNFYHGLKRNCSEKSGDFKDIDFGKFVSKIVGDRKLIRTYYYNASVDQGKDPERYRKQRQFFENLRKIPNFKVVLVRLQKRTIDGETVYAIKGDDIHLATDLIVLAYNNAYDTALIVSGDADFIPAIKAVQEKGKQVENHYFKLGGSFQLRQECNRSVKITEELLRECKEIRK
jgi:uncharacterized LabA/DUF88 family protein